MFKTLIVKCLSDNYAYVCYNENNEAIEDIWITMEKSLTND